MAEWIKKLVCLYNGTLFSLKENEILLFITWMDLKNIMLIKRIRCWKVELSYLYLDSGNFLQLHPCLFPGLLYSLPLCYFLFHLIGQFIYFENPANYSSIVVWFEKGYPSIHVANILLQSLFQWRDEKAWIGTQWRGLWCNKWCPHSVSLVTGTKQWNRNTVFYFWFSIVIICTY